jgi:hypothetical protein
LTDWLKILYDDRDWPEFFDVLSLEKSLHHGPKFNFLWNFLISDFHEIAVLSIWTLYGFVVHDTCQESSKSPWRLSSSWRFWNFPELPRFKYSDKIFLIHLTNHHINFINWQDNQNLTIENCPKSIITNYIWSCL